MRQNLQLRIITALIGIPVTVLLVVLGGWALFALAAVVAVVASMEFTALLRGRCSKQPPFLGALLTLILLGLTQWSAPWSWYLWWVALAAASHVFHHWLRGEKGWHTMGRCTLSSLAGVVYVGLPILAMLHLREAGNSDAFWLILVLVLTWATDSFSYLAGRVFGNRLLAPRISPKKTIEGVLGGWLGGSVAGYVALQLSGQYAVIYLPLILFAPPVAVFGDLWESAMKRYFQSKDSRLAGFNLFPGHGGVLDRIDALLFVAPTVVLYLMATRTVLVAGI
ncbi:MAG: phosphatidate cytidylyltransferase [Anaerolineaceae bacterium]|nr:phosphatidate cytidylyltransferase [Anaerolineaceae bacterium]